MDKNPHMVDDKMLRMIIDIFCKNLIVYK